MKPWTRTWASVHKLADASPLGDLTTDRDVTFSLNTTLRLLLHHIPSSRTFASFRNVFFSLSVYLILYVHEVALTSRPTVKVYLQFSSRLLWNWSWIQFEATRRASKQKLARGEAVCRCHIVRRTSNENWWHNYELRCVCAVVACCVVSSHHSIRPLSLPMSDVCLPISPSTGSASARA